MNSYELRKIFSIGSQWKMYRQYSGRSKCTITIEEIFRNAEGFLVIGILKTVETIKINPSEKIVETNSSTYKDYWIVEYLLDLFERKWITRIGKTNE